MRRLACCRGNLPIPESCWGWRSPGSPRPTARQRNFFCARTARGFRPLHTCALLDSVVGCFGWRRLLLPGVGAVLSASQASRIGIRRYRAHGHGGSVPGAEAHALGDFLRAIGGHRFMLPSSCLPAASAKRRRAAERLLDCLSIDKCFSHRNCRSAYFSARALLPPSFLASQSGAGIWAVFRQRVRQARPELVCLSRFVISFR